MLKQFRVIVSAMALWSMCGFAQQQNSAGTGSPAPVATTQGVYRLQAGDTIDIRLFFNPELNETVQIRPDGRISLQLIGEFQVAGQTIEEATKLLTQKYAAEVTTPRVSVQVRTFATQKVFVTGEVIRPGPVNMPASITLLDALSEAGGVTRKGDETRVVLVRKSPDGAAVGRIVAPLSKGLPTADASIVLNPFDVILVPETKIARLDRWVDQHIRQMIPFNTNVGFTYLLQNTGGGTIPIF